MHIILLIIIFLAAFIRDILWNKTLSKWPEKKNAVQIK